MDTLIGYSITWCISRPGHRRGRKVFPLKTLPDDIDEPFTTRAARTDGHDKPERLSLRE